MNKNARNSIVRFFTVAICISLGVLSDIVFIEIIGGITIIAFLFFIVFIVNLIQFFT